MTNIRDIQNNWKQLSIIVISFPVLMIETREKLKSQQPAFDRAEPVEWKVYSKSLYLNLNFLTQNETYLIDFLILDQTLTSGKLFYRSIKLETTDTEFHPFGLRLRFKYGRIAAVSKAHLQLHLPEFYGIRHPRDWNMAQFVSECQ